MKSQLRTDFLKHMGIQNPTESDYQKIKTISDSQILSTLIPGLKERRLSQQAIANKYGTTKRVVQNAWEKSI